MNTIDTIIDFVLHINKYLGDMIDHNGDWVYLIFFLIIFCETGIIITPFLPGDSLIFAASTFAATGHLDLQKLTLTFICAAILGDFCNYSIGRLLGPKLIGKDHFSLINKSHIHKTQHFYAQHGSMAIVLGRFLPIFRTFVPFLAGIGKMKRSKFLKYSSLGTFLWVIPNALGGFYFGTKPFVKENFSFVILAIMVITLIPIGIVFILDKSEVSTEIEDEKD